jgi:type IV secretion system protein TrbL
MNPDDGPLDLNIIDVFLKTFIQYIDSGFGLLSGDVAFLTTILIGIDVTLAALWWAMDNDQDVLGKLIKKVLYVGAFAFILGNFNHLADIIFRSFEGLGITASGGGISPERLMQPGAIGGTGFDVAWPLLKKAGQMMGFPAFFGNFLNIAVLLICWLLVVLAFFILAIQLFITILEFKLTSLAGFVLVPFALWNKTSFLAERVLGSVISSGIKVMVLAVIIGIGTTLFGQMAAVLGGDPGTKEALTLLMGALTLFGLAIFGPSIAAGLVSGAPQLGAGAAVGAVAGAAIATGGAAMLGAKAAMGGLSAIRAGTAMGSAAQTSYKMGQAAAGAKTVGAGLRGMGAAADSAMNQKIGAAASRVRQGFQADVARGRSAAWQARNMDALIPGGGGKRVGAAPQSTAQASAGAAPAAAGSAPQWAQKLRSEQTSRHRRHMAAQTIKDGDRPGGAANPDLSDKE